MKKTISTLFVLAIFSLLANLSAQTVRYVRTGTIGDGQSWATASSDLQGMIDDVAALGGGEVWVAAGTYIPNKPLVGGLSSKHNTFVLKQNVKVYGGFSASGTPAFTDRNPEMYETILSGDIGRNDKFSGTKVSDQSIGYNESEDNAYHVLVSVGDVGTALLDGFTVRNGKGKWTGSNPSYNGFEVSTELGGGILLVNSTAVISNCKIIYNQGKGAGFCSVHSGGNTNKIPYVLNCRFMKNYAGDSYHGAVYTSGGYQTGFTVFVNCLIAENRAKINSPACSGGLYLDGDAKLVNVTIANNYPAEVYLAADYFVFNSLIFGGIGGTNTQYLNERRQKKSLIEGSPVADYSIASITASQIFNNISEILGASDYTLKSGTQAINGASESIYNEETAADKNPNLPALAQKDVAGNNRKVGIVDLGAYEASSGVFVGNDEINNNAKLYLRLVADHLFIEGLTSDAKVEVVDLSGKVVLKNTISKENRVDVGCLARGVYVVRVSDGDVIVTEKLYK